MQESFTLSDLADLNKSIAEYKEISFDFPQYGMGEEKERLIEFLEKYNSKENYYKSSVLAHWENINIHVTFQVWSSTACGWGGIGGSAMTRACNVIIHQKYTNLAFVYWRGILAYITSMDNIPDINKVPSLQSAKGTLYRKGFITYKK